VFPEGHTERASATYGLHDRETNRWRLAIAAVPGHEGHLSFDVQPGTDHLRALAWAPGCMMKQFDVPIEKSDVEVKFACDPLKTVPFHGRIKDAEAGRYAMVTVSYVTLGTWFWIQDLKGEWVGSSAAPQIREIATAPVSRDGTFIMEMPDFSADPIASSDGWAYLDFRIVGGGRYSTLEPTTAIKIAPSYPAEVIFTDVSF